MQFQFGAYCRDLVQSIHQYRGQISSHRTAALFPREIVSIPLFRMENHSPKPQANSAPSKPRLSHQVNGQSPLHSVRAVGEDVDGVEQTSKAIHSSMSLHRVALDLESLSFDEQPQPTDNPRADPPVLGRTSAVHQYEEVADQDIEDLDVKVSARGGTPNGTTAPAAPQNMTRSSTPSVRNPTIDFDGLSWPSSGTLARLREQSHPVEAQARLDKLSGAMRTILECIGEDPDREGLHGTPERFAKAMMFFTKGYEENLRDIVNGAVFHEDHDELVIVRDIEVYSLCEHHLVPFTGKVLFLSSPPQCLSTKLFPSHRCISATSPLAA